MAIEALFVNDGNMIDYTPSGAVAAGQVVIIGSLIGVVNRDAAAGEKVGLHVRGTFDLVKADTVTASQGADVYWDESADEAVFASGTGNTLIGTLLEDAAAGDTHVSVLIR